MIQIIRKEDCCGCNACGDVCSKHAISFKTDIEGFWYPEIDVSLCVDCGLCEKVCPIVNKANNVIRYDNPFVFAAYSKDEAIRLDSTSGGIHSMLAQAIYQRDGYISGAVYNEDHTVSHIVDPNPTRLPEIRSSKYLQSNSEGIYKEIRSLLKQGRQVLFCGCPCQVHALYNIVGHDAPNLTTCDFICRGVNSPKVFLKYIEMLEREYGAKATEIKFKNKKWGWHNFSLRVNFANGKEYCKDRWHDLFFIGYLQSGNFARPSCYQCQFKGFPQKTDITLADFWGIENVDPSMDQDKGTSLVMINSEKGQELFNQIKSQIIWKEFTFEDTKKGNPAISSSIKTLSNDRNDFFRDLDNYPFDVVANRYFPPVPGTEKAKPNSNFVRRVIQKYRSFRMRRGNVNYSLGTFYSHIRLNLFCSHIVKKIKFPLSNYKHCIFQFDEDSHLILESVLIVGQKQVRKSKLETRIWLEENAKMTVKGNFTIFAGSYIRIVKGGHLILHGGFLNENVQITCGGKVEIGEGCTIARDVVIRSYDAHHILDDNYKNTKDITIGKHVWVGQGAQILKGVTIGDGAIIAAGSIVTKDVPSHSVVAGVPACVIRENVEWMN